MVEQDEEQIKHSINMELGIEQFGGDDEMFLGMVGRFEELTFDEGLRKLHVSALQKDWKEYRHQAHTLKGASAYLAATTVQDLCLKMQLRCDKFFKETEDGKTVSRSQKRVFEQDAIELLLQLFHYSKFLKIRIAQIDKRGYDISPLQYYEEDVRREYPPPPPQCCGGCKIF